MSILISISLSIIVVITLFSVIAGQDWTFSGLNNGFAEGYSFNVDALAGGIAILIIVISLVSIIGIRIFNSGLSESSIRTITICFVYASLWALFSALSYSLLIEIAYVGLFIYLILTLIFVFGVLEKVSN